MKLKILYTHLLKLSEDLLITDTVTCTQKQKRILNGNHHYSIAHQIVHSTHQKRKKTTKTKAILFKKTNFE